ncbi:ABC transporter permease [Atopobacter sp. AH10]|uniref:ABC transporter permease n=1 Tax=Atopobacter sp. AH10 TaxID=2315861 RepID=UPI000EF201ED|nr:ABC transporter permease subunit [Atopobacter sp. AH10]RLK63798.1 ABC transporter permease [Atopobacter sp. AH10]
MKLVKIELFKLFHGGKVIYFYAGFAGAVALLILYLRMAASLEGFGEIFQTSIDTFSIFAVIVGVLWTLTSFNQEIQQKTMKNLLVTPVKRGEILGAKWLTGIFASTSVLLVLGLVAFVMTTLLFGFFTAGEYSSASEGILSFWKGIVQMVSSVFTAVFYSSIVLFLFLISNSLSISLVAVLVLRGIGEMLARSLIQQPNLFLYFSPLGALKVLNPISSHISFIAYFIQLLLILVYAVATAYVSIQLFERKEF